VIILTEFIPGLKLAGLFYQEVVRPIIEMHYPKLVYSAGLLGPGSEVLGFDTAMSADHDWGPRLHIFLSPSDQTRIADDLREILGQRLPFTFGGYSTHFIDAPDDPGVTLRSDSPSRPINHRVRMTTLRDFIQQYTGRAFDRELNLIDWLTIPEQTLRSLTAGAIFYDELGTLEPLRRKLAYYPHQVWLYILSAQWQRIGQEEPFVGRTGLVGDELGSTIIAARLVRDVMRLCFLMEKQYAPYPKWFGAAFAQLKCAGRLTPILDSVLKGRVWQELETHLSTAYEIIASMHNDLNITEPISSKVSQFHDRPFMVIQGERFAQAIWETITDKEVRALPYGVGKSDQYVDSTDILSYPERFSRLASLYAKE